MVTATSTVLYLSNAPDVLITRLRHTINTGHRQLLQKLLTSLDMKQAWKIIEKSVQSNDGYEMLWRAIISAQFESKRTPLNQLDRREKYNDIAEAAKKLSRLIAERSGRALPYRGELDLHLFEFFPEQLARINGARSYATMDADQRSRWAYSIMRVWPTMVELLGQLEMRAKQKGRERASLIERSRDQHPETRIFSRHLYDYLRKVDPTFTGFNALSAITSITLGIRPPLTSRKMRAMILGSSGKATH
jgi:hypothetical protein